MKQFRKLNPDRERLLYILFVFRSIPRHYFTKGISRDDKKFNDGIYTLVKGGYVVEVKAYDGDIILYLARKGYNYITQMILGDRSPQYNYMTSRSRRITGGPHFYMNLVFVWRFLTKNWNKLKDKDLLIYTDTDVNNCRLLRYSRTSNCHTS